VSYFAYQIAGQKRDADEVVREWIADNSARVDSWLGL